MAEKAYRLLSGQLPWEFSELEIFAQKLSSRISEDDEKLLRLCQQPYGEEPYLFNQAVNTAILAAETGIGFGYGLPKLTDLVSAAMLHDAVLFDAQTILEYPKELHQDKRAEVMKHPLICFDKLKDRGIKESVLAAILQHHERMDGNGYPQGLHGGQISEMARILQVVDAFEAATHPRPYRKEKSYSETVKEIFDLSGQIYDPLVIKALVNRICLYPLDTVVELSSGQIAKVVSQNKNFPVRPMVQVQFNSRGHKVDDSQVLVLKMQLSVHIIGPMRDVEPFSKVAAEKHKSKKKRFSLPEILTTVIGFLVALSILLILLKL